MERINDREVELTDAESVVHDWFQSLLSEGKDMVDAYFWIVDRVTDDSMSMKILKDVDFCRWLLALDEKEKLPQTVARSLAKSDQWVVMNSAKKIKPTQ